MRLGRTVPAHVHAFNFSWGEGTKYLSRGAEGLGGSGGFDLFLGA